MKKAFIVSLIAISTIAACKKDKTKPNDSSYSRENMHEYIQRLWHTTSETRTYYSQTNDQLYQENNNPGIVYNILDTTLRRTDLQGKTVWGKYMLSKSNNTDVITITPRDSSPNTALDSLVGTFEITSIDDSTMIWQEEKANQSYTQDGQQKTAAKEVHIIKFHCPCVPH